MKIKLLVPLYALVMAFACACLPASDLTITYTATSKGMWASGGGGTEVHYYNSKFLLNRNEAAKRDSLVDFEKGISYSIDHKKKTIDMVKLADALAALEGLSQAQPEGMGALMGTMFGDPNEVKVEKLDTETIAGRKCQKYNIKAGKLAMAMSADPTLKAPVAEAAYARMIQARAASLAKAGPMGASFKRLYEELAKVNGIPLKTHMTGFMGLNVATEATKIDESPIPASLFGLPADYKLVDMGKKMREEMKKQ